MTESMKMAIMAVNKWVFFGWNFTSVEHEWISWNGQQKREIIPRFLVEVKWTCNLDHMLSKWRTAVSKGTPDSYLVRFYAGLDDRNRVLLLEWVMQNYNDEIKILNYE